MILFIFFSQIRRGASFGRAIEFVTVITFTNAVVIIIGAFGYVYAVDPGVVITFTVVYRDMGIMIQMVDRPNTTPIGQDKKTLTFKALL